MILLSDISFFSLSYKEENVISFYMGAVFLPHPCMYFDSSAHLQPEKNEYAVAC